MRTRCLLLYYVAAYNYWFPSSAVFFLFNDASGPRIRKTQERTGKTKPNIIFENQSKFSDTYDRMLIKIFELLLNWRSIISTLLDTSFCKPPISRIIINWKITRSLKKFPVRPWWNSTSFSVIGHWLTTPDGYFFEFRFVMAGLESRSFGTVTHIENFR